MKIMTVETVVLSNRAALISGTARIAVQQTIEHLVQRVRSEYLEMPGLNLTRGQVQRLWNLDSDTCDVLLETLINGHFLRQTPNGAYVRTDDGPQLTPQRPWRWRAPASCIVRSPDALQLSEFSSGKLVRSIHVPEKIDPDAVKGSQEPAGAAWAAPGVKQVDDRLTVVA
jgi:hypothetical protein